MKKIPLSGFLKRPAAAKKWLAGSLLAASLVTLGTSQARAQGAYTVAFSGTANQIYGTGNGVPNDAAVIGDITINPNTLTTVYETPNFAEYTGVGPVYNTINGTVSEYQDIDIYIAYNTTDLNNNPASGFAIYWGPNDSDGVTIYDSVNVVQNASLSSFETMLGLGLSESLPYPGDAIFGVGFDASGYNGGEGNLATLSLVFNNPTLEIQPSAANIVLSWTTNAPNARLASSQFLGQAWSPVTNAPVVSGSNYQVTLPLTPAAPAQFFCLLH